MRTRTIIWLMVVTGLVCASISACGTINTAGVSPSGSFPAIPAAEQVYVLDGTANQEQHIIDFHPGDRNTFSTTPAGLISLDHQRVYVAASNNGQTTVTVFALRTGMALRSFVIPGTYSTEAQAYRNAVLSGDGHWLAMRELGQSNVRSIIALVDVTKGTLFKTIQLTGDFDLDAVSPNGTRLYLLQRLHDQADHYYVRLYHVDKNQLDPNPIVDKTDVDPRMIGSALTREMSSDGSIAYTLYTEPRHNIAFVHILPLANDYLGARCIDLPVGRSPELLRYYSLALSADGSTLYAVNGALGVVRSISVADPAVFSDHTIATIHFDPGQLGRDTLNIPTHGAALSSEQRAVYFAASNKIWSFDTNTSQVRTVYAAQQAVTSVAFSTVGRVLYATLARAGIMRIDTATGRVQPLSLCPAMQPQTIVSITAAS